MLIKFFRFKITIFKVVLILRRSGFEFKFLDMRKYANANLATIGRLTSLISFVAMNIVFKIL